MEKKRRKPILGFICIFLSFGMLYVLLNTSMQTLSKKEEIAQLEKRKAAIEKEKKDLENEVDLLNDDGYVTRYARENYIFTKDGEQVAILPDIDKK